MKVICDNIKKSVTLQAEDQAEVESLSDLVAFLTNAYCLAQDPIDRNTLLSQRRKSQPREAQS